MLEDVYDGKIVGVFLCDQSAAFDICDHYLLIEKMKLMGVEDTAWFWSYLSGRMQSCSIDGQVSAPLSIPSCGVPQGSIGGPILWLLFTCDQPDVTHEHTVNAQDADRGCGRREQGVDGQDLGHGGDFEVGCGELVGYVDDGAYSYSDANPATLSQVLTRKFEMLQLWMNANRLVLNPDKTHLIVMGSRRHRHARKEVSLVASGHVIKPSVTEKLLGGQLHESLTWNTHIRDTKSSLISQLTSRINALRRVCQNGSFKTKLKVANGIIMSKLSYLITVWGGAQEYLLDALQVQQLSAARVVCGFYSKFWSKRRLLKQVNWLSVRQLIFYHTVLQTHKTLSTGRPRPLYNRISNNFPYLTRGAATGQIRENEDFNHRSFKYRARKSFNKVPVEVRTGSVQTVKKKLKSWVKENIPID